MTTSPTRDAAASLLDRPDPFGYESEVRSYCRRIDVTFATASGSTMTDVDGRRYIDFLSGCSALNYGHGDPDMVAAVVRYLCDGGIIHGLDLRTTAKAEFMDAFASGVLEPRGLPYRMQFTGPTGTNAVEAAMKLARKVTGRTQIIAFTNGFHGVSAGALAATGNGHHRMAPVMPLIGVQRALFDGYLGDGVDTAELLDQLLSDPSSGFDPPAAIIVETVQGEGGLNVASNEWLRRVAAVARSHGALLIVDDIQAGCGRTGTFFSFEPAGVEPDIVTLSKSLSGLGVPMAMVLIRADHDAWAPGEHNGTFRGNNLAFVSAAVAIRKFWFDDRLTVDIQRRTRIIRDALLRMADAVPGSQLKGRGMMQGIDVGRADLADAIARRCFRNGLIIETSGPNDEVVKVLAALTTPDGLLEEGLSILADAIVAEAGLALAGR